MSVAWGKTVLVFWVGHSVCLMIRVEDICDPFQFCIHVKILLISRPIEFKLKHWNFELNLTPKSWPIKIFDVVIGWQINFTFQCYPKLWLKTKPKNLGSDPDEFVQMSLSVICNLGSGAWWLFWRCKALPQNTIIMSYFAWPPTPVSTLASSCVIFP